MNPDIPWFVLILVVVCLDTALVLGTRNFKNQQQASFTGRRNQFQWIVAYIGYSLDEFLESSFFFDRPQNRLKGGIVLGTGMVMMIAGQTMRINLVERDWISIFVLLGGMAVYSSGLWMLRPFLARDILSQFEDPSFPTSRLKSWQWFSLLLAAILVGLVCVQTARGGFLRFPGLSIGLWITGVVCAVLAGFNSVSRISWRSFLRYLPILALLFLLAGLPRFFGLEVHPPLLINDEASGGLDAAAFLNGNSNNIFSTGWFSFPSMFFALQSLGLLLFGQTTTALRFIPAVAGTATVLLIYWAGNELFDRRIALIAAVFLAVFHLHVHFSRLGLNNIYDGLFFTLTFTAFIAAWRKGSRFYFVLFGLGLGFSLYFYASSKALLVLIPFLLAWLARGNTGRLKNALPSLFMAFYIAFLVFAPLGAFYLVHPKDALTPIARVDQVRVWGESSFHLSWSQMGTDLVVKIIQGIRLLTDLPVDGWYVSIMPVLLILPAIAFFIGSLLILFNLQRDWAKLLIVWFSLVLLIAGLSVGAIVQRLVAVFPALALIVALGSVVSLDWIVANTPRFKRLVLLGFLGLILLASAQEANNYFVSYRNRSHFDDTNWVAQGLAEYLKEKPAGTRVIMFTMPAEGFYSMSTLPYLAPQVKPTDRSNPWGDHEKTDDFGKYPVFVFRIGMQTSLTAVQKQFPGGKLTIIPGYKDAALVWIYDLAP